MEFFDFSSNPYFSAGFGLFGLGVAGKGVQKGASYLAQYLSRRFFTTLEVPIFDPAYPWLMEWLGKHEASRLQSKFLSPPPPHILSVNTTFMKRDNGSSVASIALRPGIGTYWINYKNQWFLVTRKRETKMVDLMSGKPYENIEFRTLAMNKELFQEMLQEAKKMALEKEVGKTVVYTSMGPEWKPFGLPRRRRFLSSVILQDKISEEIYQDVREFMQNGKWYFERGIPYRRGYLLHGPPGSGKTSFIQALAGELEYNVCVLSLADKHLTDDRLAHLLSNAPPRSIIVLEDIDAALATRDPSQKQTYTMLTFSGLLNALDGIASSEERIVFMTTNHVERLDPALIRPGRVDVKKLIGYATDEQIERMFLHFYPGSSRSREFSVAARGAAADRPISTAALQGLFVKYRDESEKAIQNVNDMFNQ